MKLSDFILLDPDQKKHSVLHDGILIAKRKENNALIFLFGLDNFYVEMYCHTIRREVMEYRFFKDAAQLTPYLEEITLDGLF